MKLAPARQTAYAALLAIDRGAWSAEALAAKSIHLDPRDAGLASDIVFGTLRHKGELDHVIGKLCRRPVNSFDPEVRLAMEMALYQVRFLDRVPDHAAVNDSVELAKRAGKVSAVGFINGILRNALRENPHAPESASTPAWLLSRWRAQYGSRADAIAHASLSPKERFIRVGQGVPPEGAEATDVAGCYRLPFGDPGPYRFQDISSQTIIPLLELQAGQSFLDLCAAPGNKTAQALETDVEMIACDVNLSRARGMLSLPIPIIVLDASQPLPFAYKFDRILVDAPCSGTGTLSGNPEIKWRLGPADIPDLHRRQVAILKNALQGLTPDGLLVYSTCSLEREENEEVIAASGAKVLKTVQRLPGRDAGDGFFAAVLQAI